MYVNCNGYFNLIGCIEGKGSINGLEVKMGDHLLIPHGIKSIEIDGTGQFILTQAKA